MSGRKRVLLTFGQAKRDTEHAEVDQRIYFTLFDAFGVDRVHCCSYMLPLTLLFVVSDPNLVTAQQNYFSQESLAADIHPHAPDIHPQALPLQTETSTHTPEIG